jgi:hypothetical protein
MARRVLLTWRGRAALLRTRPPLRAPGVFREDPRLGFPTIRQQTRVLERRPKGRWE